jgi:hypothetical protein
MADLPTIWVSVNRDFFMEPPGCKDARKFYFRGVYLLGKLTERRQNYRELVTQAVDPDETDAIRRHLQHQRVYGPDRFRLAIERQLGRKLGPRKIGRPKKPVIETDDLLESRL